MKRTALRLLAACVGLLAFAAPAAAQEISEDSLRRAPTYTRYADLFRDPISVLKLEVTTPERAPEALGQAANLRELTIRGEGGRNIELVELPPAAYTLPHLEKLTIENTGLQTISPAIDSLRQLEVLILRDNPDLKQLPEALGKLPLLRTLAAGDAALPASLGELDSLRALETSRPDFPPLPQLDSLVYSGKKVPAALGACPGLKSAAFLHPKINLSDAFDFLLELDDLESVAFHAEAADRRAWEKLSRMTSVTKLEVVSPQGLPADITDLPLLRQVVLTDAFCLQEEACKYIFNPLVEMDFIETLTLNNYATEIHRLKNLRRVEIVNSADLNVLDFTGLHAQLVSLPKLEALSLKGTRLDGARNVRLDSLPRLRELNLAYTLLPEDGELWNQLLGLDSLKTLILSTDDLGAGKLAPGLLEMKQLEKLVVYNKRGKNKLLFVEQQKAQLRKRLPDCEVIFYQ